ncbi:hypothetical protein [Nocardiopsis potens]|uniref:hypothetical protein n=1 Tax=Nocardiopsis potens TaxID=1246458 RepID=UPI00034DAF67|nr:hypothetical protein [Nocardiopsis potens]
MPFASLPPGSALAAALTEEWGLVPLRWPAGWRIHHNQILARRLPSGACEVNDSEDLLWASLVPVMNLPEGPEWEPVTVDAGWYRDRFRIDVLRPDWDNVAASHETADPAGFVEVLDDWLRLLAQGRFPEPPAP